MCHPIIWTLFQHPHQPTIKEDAAKGKKKVAVTQHDEGEKEIAAGEVKTSHGATMSFQMERQWHAPQDNCQNLH